MPSVSDSMDESERRLNGINDRTYGWGHEDLNNPHGPADGGAPITIHVDLRDQDTDGI